MSSTIAEIEKVVLSKLTNTNPSFKLDENWEVFNAPLV